MPYHTVEPRRIGDRKNFLTDFAVPVKNKRRHNTRFLIGVYVPAIKSVTKAYLRK